MYKYPFLALAARLRQESDLKAVKFNRDQDANDGEITTQPMVLIRFLDGNTRSLGKGIQEIIDQQVEVKIITVNVHDSDKAVDTPTGQPDHDAAIDQVHALLSGHDIRLSDIAGMEELADTDDDLQIFGTLDRKRIRPMVPGQGGRLVTTMIFQGTMYDYSAMKQFQAILKDLSIDETGWI